MLDAEARTVGGAFRADIEGLRAVAVLLVLLFHAGLPIPGGFVGVDLFFVISGFLITGLLLRDVEARGRVDLIEFYARRAKRLVPAATAVLVVALLLTSTLAPRSQRSVFAIDVIAAATFSVNWRLAARSVSYVAEDVGRSPVLHFWSLSVEEQFYFVWPALITAAAIVAKRLGRPPRPLIATALALVVVGSFAWSLAFTSTNPTEAFFVTETRLWELGVGGLLALGRTRVSAWPARLALPLACGGAALVAASAFLSRANAEWPGWRALAPTLGVTLLLASGTANPRNLVSQSLSSRPLVWVGGLSYSIYLWHWPLLIAQGWLGLRGYAWTIGCALASVVVAWLSHQLIERPIRFSRYVANEPRFALSLGLNLSLAAVVGGGLVYYVAGAGVGGQTGGATTSTVRRGPHPAGPLGAVALGGSPRDASEGRPHQVHATITPSPATANQDLSRGHLQKCLVEKPTTRPSWCKIGSPSGSQRVVVVGDSKIFQYFDALDRIGLALNWEISVATKAACPFVDAMVLWDGVPFEACGAFNRAVMDALRVRPPHAIITSQHAKYALPPGARAEPDTPEMIDGLSRRWAEVLSWGTRVAVVLDTPGTGLVYECLLQNPDHHETCAFDRAQAIEDSAAPIQRAAARRVPGVHVIDLTDYICPQSLCAPIIGDVLVYRQGSHITNTYALSLTPILLAKLAKVLSD